MGVFLFSLAGIPPLAGFIGKFYLFAAILQNGGFWYVLLAVVGILNSAIALFYYTLIVREMFLRQPEVETRIKARFAVVTLITLLAIPTLLLGIYWEPLPGHQCRIIRPGKPVKSRVDLLVGRCFEFIVAVAQKSVGASPTVFSATQKMLFVVKKMLSEANNMVCVSKKMFPVAETLVTTT
jgi:NADH:ubiquinone oxidoreductase subunit 5 (subunit L)/multisubunit Na+/H+ antiporter MnhA subunit